MQRRCGIHMHAIMTVVTTAAAIACCFGVAAAQRLYVETLLPGTRHSGEHKPAGVLHYNKSIKIEPGHPVGASAFPSIELLPAANQSCASPFGKYAYRTSILLKEAANTGDWILLAGLYQQDGPAGPISPQTEDAFETTNWFYAVEMLFIPMEKMSVSAGLAFDSKDIQNVFVVPEPNLNLLQIGVAISIDYGAAKPAVIDLGYGRLPVEGRASILQSGMVEVDRPSPVDLLSKTWIFSACLNIRF